MKFLKLDALRGIAACLVVLFHSPFKYKQASMPFVAHSYLFVDLFFVLSGFVMCLAYSQRIQDGLSLKKYTSLRLGRLYPLHLCVLAAWVPYVLIKQYMYSSGFGGSDQTDVNNLQSLAAHASLLSSIGLLDYLGWNSPAWSISAEFLTYILFFITTSTLDKKKSLMTPLAISICAYLFLMSQERELAATAADYGFIRCIAAFYLGIFIFRLRYIKLQVELPSWGIQASELFCLIAITGFVTTADWHPLAYVPAILTFALCIWVFSQTQSGWIGKLLETSLLRQIGEWSYSIYMTHALILAILANFFQYVLKWPIERPLGVTSLAINAAAMLMVIWVSKYTYVHIENRFRLKAHAFIERQWPK